MRPPKPYSSRASTRGRVSQSIGELGQEIATTRDGRDIVHPFTAGLQQPRDPRLLGAVDWGVYDRILMDDQVFSTFQQRRLAVVSYNWHVLPGDDSDPRSVEAADRFSKTIDRLGWDRITDKMLYATFYGHSVAEVMWGPGPDNLLDFRAVRVRHARRFRFNDKAELRLLTRTAPMGEQLPPRKFWTVTCGGSNDDELYGRGLAEWLYWPTLFKKNGLRFWNTFLDKFGSPTAVGKYRPGTPRTEINKLLGALQAMATDSGIVVPEGVAIELLEAARSGTADYHTLCRYMDAAIAKIILSQTMTTDNGSSRSQAEVHAGVKLEVVKSDADLLSDSFNEGPARWWTDINYGTDVASPRLMREVEEESDTKAEAETDKVLYELGWERDDESFHDNYGEGYRRRETPDAKPAPAGKQPPAANQQDPEDPEDDGDPQDDSKPASFAADDPRPLYVYRRLTNAAELLDWARGQGFTSLVPPEDLHVTIMYSKRPVNWLKMGGFWGWNGDTSDHLVPYGGPRIVEPIGEEGAVALFFFSGHLQQRNREMRDAGASWDYPDYLPHVTLTYDVGSLDLAQVKPYQGELRFGPEIFEPLQDDWHLRIQEASFAAPPGPAVEIVGPSIEDRSDELADEVLRQQGYRAAAALTDPVLGAIRTADSAEELTALLNAAPGNEAPLAKSGENASFALALDAENGD